MLAEEHISEWLTYFTDLGIVTTPFSLLGKSGSFSAFKEFSVPVIVSTKEDEFRSTLGAVQSGADYFYDVKKNIIVENSSKQLFNSTLEKVGNLLLTQLDEVENYK